jgi:hypothetical protein
MAARCRLMNCKLLHKNYLDIVTATSLGKPSGTPSGFVLLAANSIKIFSLKKIILRHHFVHVMTFNFWLPARAMLQCNYNSSNNYGINEGCCESV